MTGTVQPYLPGTDDLAGVPARQSRARSQARAFDVALVALARVNYPDASWWWVFVTTERPAVTRCLVCGQTITTPLPGPDSPVRSGDPLDDHRASHAQDVAAWRAAQ